MSQDSVYVLGCGGHAKVVIQTLRALGRDVAVIFDDDPAKCEADFLGIPVQQSIDRVVDFPRREAVIAVGDNTTRAGIALRLDLEWLTLVHPRACVDPLAELGPGTVVFAGAVIQADTRIGSHVIINTAASVDHDCAIGDFVHIAPGARIAGGVVIADRTLLGIGSTVVPEIRIGARAKIGAGAVVTRNIDSGVTAIGVPARVIGGRHSS